jgi:hypothetical protein
MFSTSAARLRSVLRFRAQTTHFSDRQCVTSLPTFFAERQIGRKKMKADGIIPMSLWRIDF